MFMAAHSLCHNWPVLKSIALAVCLVACEEIPPGEYPNAGGSAVLESEQDEYEDTDPSALTEFRATLDSHGAWVEDPTYGTVWVPASAEVGADFTPYVTAGHWAYDDEWIWVSDYDWGWAPFHYGRWIYIDGRGWAWIPGRRYAGAWVVWGYDGGYLAWAAMPPAWYWRSGVAIGFEARFGYRWMYCPRGDVFAPGLRSRVIWGDRAVGISARPYTAATPGVASHPFGSQNFGPHPQSLGIDSGSIPHTSNHAGVSRAQQYARPSTAAPLGASAPTFRGGVHGGGGFGGAGMAAPSSPRMAAPSGPRVAPPAVRLSVPALVMATPPGVIVTEVPPTVICIRVAAIIWICIAPTMHPTGESWMVW